MINHNNCFLFFFYIDLSLCVYSLLSLPIAYQNNYSIYTEPKLKYQKKKNKYRKKKNETGFQIFPPPTTPPEPAPPDHQLITCTYKSQFVSASESSLEEITCNLTN